MTHWISVQEWKSQGTPGDRGLIKPYDAEVDLGGVSSELLREFEKRGDPLDDISRSFPWTISNEQRDREGDRIMVDGWKLKNTRRNPVVQWAHDYKMPSIARMTRVWRDTAPGGFKRLRAIKQFTPEGMNPFADMIYEMVKAGFQQAASVGFIPILFQKDETLDETERKRFAYPLLYKEQELLESSILPVPAHPDAIQEAKNLKIDLRPLVDWSERVLDEKLDVGVPRELIEQTRKIVVPELKIFDLGFTKTEQPVNEILEALKALEARQNKLLESLDEKIVKAVSEAVEKKLEQKTADQAKKDLEIASVKEVLGSMFRAGETQ